MTHPALATLAGTVRSANGDGSYGVCDHACLGYSDERSRTAMVVAWLGEGLAQGQRAVYVADEPVDELRAELAGIPDRDARMRRGDLVLCRTSDVYDLSRPIEADTQLAFYDRAVRQALSDGFRGLRIAADITSLVSDPDRRPAHVHWEQVADRYATDQPMAPLCLYDLRRVSALDAVAGCHPLQGPRPAEVALYGERPDAAALTGDLDTSTACTLEELLAGQPDTDTTVDVSRLSFIDGRSAWMLHEHLLERREADHPLVLTGASELLHRIWDVCRFEAEFLACPPDEVVAL